MTYRVDILNPKTERLLRDLADQQMIAISETLPITFNRKQAKKEGRIKSTDYE